MEVMEFHVCRQGREMQWVVRVDNTAYGAYLDKEQALLDAVERVGDRKAYDAAILAAQAVADRPRASRHSLRDLLRRVRQQTGLVGQRAGVPDRGLPSFRTVDDIGGLKMLLAELFEGQSIAPDLCPAQARHTRALIHSLVENSDLKDRLALNALRGAAE